MGENYNIEKNGWNEWSKHILIQLKNHENKLNELVENRYTDRADIIEKITEVKSDLQISLNVMDKTLIGIIKEMELKAKTQGAWVGGIVSFIIVMISSLADLVFKM